MSFNIAENITVLVSTSWIPSCPDTTIIDTTIKSIMERLPEARILIMVDSLREELKEYKGDYREYYERLSYKYSASNFNIIYPIYFTHQANLTRLALTDVFTPLILFCEHDTPLVGDIPWEDLSHTILSEQLNVIRLSYNTTLYMEEGHGKLHMNNNIPEMMGQTPIIKTAQWSQRPHLASTEFYRRILTQYFTPESKTFIEAVMHGVVGNSYMMHGIEGWEKFKVGIYHPEGDIQRSTHLDGSVGGPRFTEMIFKYPGGITPEGAPQQTIT